jgi:outer membrane beta-barrel protein
MANRIQRILLSGALLLPLQGLSQETDDAVLDSIVDPGLERRELKENKIDSEDFELGFYLGGIFVEDFGSSFVYGLNFAYHITEDFFLEAAYGRTEVGKTSFEELSGDIEILSDEDRQFSYYNISLGYKLFPGEVFVGKHHAFNSDLYLIAGVGNTDFAGSQRFTVNFGVGYRFFATDWMAWRMDLRDYVFDIDVLGENKTTHNLEVRTGLTFFF